MGSWPAISYKEYKWTKGDMSFLSKTQRSKITATYQAAIPLKIRERTIQLPNDLEVRISELLVKLARFDTQQSAKEYNFPAMLLRSESVASSKIERLSSSIRNIALAEISEKAPKNAKEIVQNVYAMRTALELSDELTIDNIIKIQKVLLEGTEDNRYAGRIRQVQNWIGGTNYSPHGAIYVPPRPELINEYLADLIAFSERTDINPIVKTIILHAQFETIHPFEEGNGRTGRTLLHKLLRKEDILLTTTLPISAGLLHNIDAYMESIIAYQKGNPLKIIEQFVSALELSLGIGQRTVAEVEEVLQEWTEKITEKKTASIWKLIHLLIEQPVVNIDYLEKKLNISDRAVRNLLNKSVELSILRKVGTPKSGVHYQADKIIDVLKDISDIHEIRRMFY